MPTDIPSPPQSYDDLTKCVQALADLASKLDTFTNGPDDGLVNIGGVDTKTILHLVKYFQGVMNENLAGSSTTLQQAMQRAEAAAAFAISAASATSGFSQYSVPVTQADGVMTIDVGQLGHPAMAAVFNPVVNVISPIPYLMNIADRSPAGFTVKLYNPDGSTPNIPVPQYIEMHDMDDSPMAMAASGVECGDSSNEDAFVYLALSVPNPGIEI